jgi:type I restriction enzyme R subunit
VEELDQENLTPLLRLKYNNAIADAAANLGPAEGIRVAFSGFRNICIRGVREFVRL